MERTLGVIMMNCSQIEIELMNGNANKEIAEHLETCEECRIFQDSLDLFIPAKPDVTRFSPSEKMDTAIREAAEREVDELCQTADMHSFFHPSSKYIHRPQKIISYLASAACGVLIAWLVVLALESTQKSRSVGGVELLTDSAVSTSLAWGDVSMDNDFLDVTTNIELNIVLLPNEDENTTLDKE